MLKKTLLLLMLITLPLGCVVRAPPGVNTLAQLEQLSAPPISRHPELQHRAPPNSKIRAMALKDAAISLGARAGLYQRSRQINMVLIRQEKLLDQNYNFYGMLLKNDILPPVLVEADRPLNLPDPETIRLAQKIYKIEEQARFVSAPPTWRDYLWMSYLPPELPDGILLPRNRQERIFWKHFVALGWRSGFEQAESIFTANLARLRRDYRGMALYRKLYAQNMVSAPFVARANLGITGDEKQMRIGDEVLRITALPKLNIRSSTWKPAIRPGDPPPPAVAEDTGATLHPDGTPAANTSINGYPDVPPPMAAADPAITIP